MHFSPIMDRKPREPEKKLIIIPQGTRTNPIISSGSRPGLARHAKQNNSYLPRSELSRQTGEILWIKHIALGTVINIPCMNKEPSGRHSFGPMSNTTEDLKC